MCEKKDTGTEALGELLDVMARLRHPERGCPWDLKQTPLSLRAHITEEAHELAQALDEGRSDRILDEMGDLLLQVVFLSRIYQEQGLFDFFAVARHLKDKLVRRHTHIFGSEKAETPEEVKALWERQKQAEKKTHSLLSDPPPSLPALEATYRLSSQAASAGFDWSDPRAALDKVREEVAELEEALQEPERAERLDHELGDLLMAVANVARLSGLQPEASLRSANKRFSRRFRKMEETLALEKKSPDACSPEQWEELWQKAKAQEALVPVDTDAKGRQQ